ncbi:copper homeostasis protein CutC [Lactobacillus selangorensis]|uniref:copper homeostasis protein CutC n=1 Tax=Lactobacillus selangorensis TaxID=81857 RepID=UPI0009E92F28|nr:copper homeostasis protein CutC [Lactobacillus selangorensis]
MIKEAAVENFTNVPKALAKGVQRIELNDNLAVGGTTPSKGVIAETTRYVHEKGASVMVMIRPRGGNFIYNDTEIKIMEADIFEAQAQGADGIVVGALTPDGLVDEDAMREFIGAAGGMEVVFHMAFDAIPADKQAGAINWLIEHHVDRILTHGAPLSEPLNVERLKEFITAADGKITILPGGGVTDENVTHITNELGVSEAHGTKIVGDLTK